MRSNAGRWRLGVVTMLIVLAAAPPAAVAQVTGNVEEILSRPISPGTIALLVEHTAVPQAQVRLGAALRDSRQEVRAAAARILFVTGNRSMANPVMVTLGGEASEAAAIEEIRFLAYFGTPDHRAAIQEAATRLGAGVASSAALDLARTEGPASLARLPLFRAAGLPATVESDVVAAASGGDRAILESTLQGALAAGDETLARAALEAAVELKIADLSEAVVSSVLSPVHPPGLRLEGVWYVARTWDGERRLSRETLREMRAALDARGGEPRDDVRFAREVVARLNGERRDTSRAWEDLLANASNSLRDLVPRPFAIETLSSKELETAARSLGRSADSIKRSRRQAEKARADTSKRPSDLPPIEAASGYPLGLAADVFKATGCELSQETDRVSSDGVAGGVVTLREQGRAAKVAILTTRVLQPGCVTAARLLLATWVATAPMPAPGSDRTILVPLDAEYFACQEASLVRPRALIAIGQGGTIKVPTKTRNVPPTYPQGALDDRVQGSVLLEATISEEGCISRVKVTTGVETRLDWAAVRAVLRWRFTPTLLDGRPVPVLMTVTVQFSLR